jgi:hypothetical protein
MIKNKVSNPRIVVINDRVKLAELMRSKGLIEDGDKTYKSILNKDIVRDEWIINRLEYYNNAQDRKKK